jgi:hypothetical protein
MNLPVLSNEDIKREPPISSSVCEEGTVQDDSGKTSVDHSYTRWDRTAYHCMYCKKTVFGKDNLASHQTSSHPGKVFCCPQCGVIIYESKQFFEEHKKTHLRKSECGEGTIKVDWHVPEDSCFKESKCVMPDSGSTIVNEICNYKESERDVKTHKSSLLEPNVGSGMALPLLNVSELDMASLHKTVHKQTDEQSVVEIVKVADICVEPERFILKKGLFQNNSKFRMKICTNFENIDSNDKSKIIETIRSIIKESENKRIKVVGPEISSQDREEVLAATDAEEISSENGAKREIKHKHWKCEHCDHLSLSWEEHLKHICVHSPVLFSCVYCGKQFSSKARLKFHTSVHTQEKPFICEYCGKCFRNRHALKNHLYTHDESEKMFECQECGKKFGTRAGYESHCACHTKASYLCDVCGKVMKHISSLRLHKLTHVDPTFFRRHCCDVCGKACRNR